VYNITATDIIGMLVAASVLIGLSLWAQSFHKNPRNIVGQRNVYFALSGVMLLVALLAIGVKGFKWGMDFTGGTIMEIGFVENQDAVTTEAVRNEIRGLFDEKGWTLRDVQVQVEEKPLGAAAGPNDFRRAIIRISKEGGNVTSDEVQAVADRLETKLGKLYRQKLKTLEQPDLSASPAPAPTPEGTEATPAAKAAKAAKAGKDAKAAKAGDTPAAEPPAADAKAAAGATTTILSRETIDPVIGKELFVNALFALCVALFLQLIYITFRFGNQIRYGIAADIALIHDVIIMAGVYALIGYQVDSPFLAAVLTVIGYSVMDSIVVFDRIRENVRHARKGNYEAICNASLNQTMTRSVNTTLTVLITLFALYFFGGETLRNFAFALLVGITMGAYSSIFIATPLVVLLDNWSKKREEERVAERRAAREAQARETDKTPRPEPIPGAGTRDYQPRRRAADATPLNEDYPSPDEMESDEGGQRASAHRKKRTPRRKK